jgi:hypothetical protein
LATKIERASYFATSKSDGKGESRLSLNAVVAECAQIVQNAAITAAEMNKTTQRGHTRIVWVEKDKETRRAKYGGDGKRGAGVGCKYGDVTHVNVTSMPT